MSEWTSTPTDFLDRYQEHDPASHFDEERALLAERFGIAVDGWVTRVG